MTKKSEKAPQAYTAPHDVYTEKQYFKAGEVFVTDEPKGEGWEAKTPGEAHIIDAATSDVPKDAPLESLDVSALKAVAVTKNVNVTGLDSKDKLITAIKAANGPRL